MSASLRRPRRRSAATSCRERTRRTRGASWKARRRSSAPAAGAWCSSWCLRRSRAWCPSASPSRPSASARAAIATARSSCSRTWSACARATAEAGVRVYGARAMGVKGWFAVHTWVAVKPTDATAYTVYEVIGWRLRWSDSALAVRNRQPDAPWFGSAPELYVEKRGRGVDELIKRIDKAARDYPYAGEYTLWPGPNSNTFTAWIARHVPELELDLPATAIGKDYLGSTVLSTAPSGGGFQLSLFGLLGIAASG